jgi:parvulin-like peptidyl-prolyl isomerase
MATKKPANKGTTKAAPKRTAAKKTTPRKTPAKTVAAKSTAPVTTSETQPKETSPQTVRVRKSYVALIVVIVLLGALIYYFRGIFVAAVVNGQPISRLEVVQQAEKQSGKQTLDTLVRDALIEQEAKKENVTVNDKEVNTEITTLQGNLKKQGQTLDQVLATQGMSQDDLKRLIRLDKLVQKMVGKNIKISDKEVSDYINKNKDSLPNADEATLKKQVKSQLTQQKTNEAVQAWLANIQQKANITYFVQY